MSPEWSIFLAVLLIALLLLGIFLLKTGLRVRRIGDAPHCPECDYNLTGLSIEVCPECGEPFTADDVAVGAPHRSPTRIASGAFCLVLAAGAALPVGRAIDWDRVKPTPWLISDLRGPNGWAAWVELKRRMKAGPLSASNCERLVDVAVALQPSAPQTGQPVFSRDLIDLTAALAADGTIPELQRRRFFENAFVMKLLMPEQVPAGAFLSFDINVESRYFGRGWKGSAALRHYKVDGERVHSMRQTVAPRNPRAWWDHLTTHTLRAMPNAGRHTLEVTYEVMVYAAESGKLVDKHTVVLSAPFEAVSIADGFGVQPRKQ